ncbi:MAG: ribonuclease J [Rickettsia endosymbiont of Ixodes persulcatus]|nr:ribonuclease J [Rickettsia endosymbiont of Ixodes persulcatus]MCZ6902114.1 ribonuclease J [Rickettsia endosymbiont of Ixodes persulcatus]MCZ6903707.1 ribonuclease J [Rickettsia endosymbiont of Ixodes persulcatus]MCZ6908537.1 ribonuclease J [Rickettsia endosymbiont of Ixodes persulcatus]MCZ6910298.1 ribonuclease J [Rickettsia endosymbiont of Ixodes persulcatus]
MSSFNIKNHKNDLLFVPLGGSNEIGMNLNLYHYKGKWLMIDCGSGFADDYLPGVDMIIADSSFIEKYKKDIVGLILTHAHEDHLGGVQYLWNSLKCPIYTTTFTANFLKIRLNEYDFAKNIKIHEVKPGSKINLDPFSLEMVPLTHSAPEMQAIMIRTEAGNILHTGDWKFDNDPILGKKADEELLKSYGDEGVLALVCDSTNVFNKGSSGSEGDVRKSLVDIIAGCPQMVVVSTFASNLARLDTIIHAAGLAGRKVVLTGRSLHRMMLAVQESGYFKDITPLISERDVSRFSREELLVIATGCQGEPMAATAKLASNSHPSIKLAPKDTMIFSSKIIPGNEKKIFRLFNIFVKAGVEVITERDHFVHVSGHPSIDELKKMYSLIRPNICIPVHGEPVHIYEHVKLAKKNGIKQAVEVENGRVVLLEPNNAKVISKVESGYLAVDGNYLLPVESPIFKARRRMRESGIVIASVVINKKGLLAANPMLSMPGLLDPKEDVALVNLIKNDIKELVTIQNKQAKKLLSDEQVIEAIKGTIRKTLKQEINKSPVIIVNIEKVISE